MAPEITPRSTKNEIIAAYEEMLKKAKETKTEEPKKVQEQQKKDTIVKNASDNSYEGILKEITQLKMSLTTALDKLGENFISEFKKFEEIQQAILIEKQNLSDLYQLSATTDSLSVMLLAQKEKKEQFEQDMISRKADFEEKIKAEKALFEAEMAEKKAFWKKEQETQAARQKEEAEDAKKNKAREEEEFQYNLKLTRKKDADVYEEKKSKLEKELTEKKQVFEKEIAARESNLREAEIELKELRARNTSFPGELEKAVTSAVKAATDKLQTEFRFEKELTAKQTEGELRLKDQIIETLKSKIKDMEVTIKELSQKTVTADANVKDIAIKAIESSSKIHILEKMKENQGKE